MEVRMDSPNKYKNTKIQKYPNTQIPKYPNTQNTQNNQNNQNKKITKNNKNNKKRKTCKKSNKIKKCTFAPAISTSYLFVESLYIIQKFCAKISQSEVADAPV